MRNRLKKDILIVPSKEEEKLTSLSATVASAVKEITDLKALVVHNIVPNNTAWKFDVKRDAFGKISEVVNRNAVPDDITWKFDINRDIHGRISKVTALNNIPRNPPWKFGISRDSRGHISGITAQKESIEQL